MCEQGREPGGLGWGDGPVAAVLAVLIVAGVAYLTVSRSGRAAQAARFGRRPSTRTPKPGTALLATSSWRGSTSTTRTCRRGAGEGVEQTSRIDVERYPYLRGSAHAQPKHSGVRACEAPRGRLPVR
jgi:hypothetical protein